MDESLLSVVGVGASTLNKTKISKMGDFKERLLFTNQPIIGYGSNDSAISPVSTAPNGSPIWSLSDDALPASLFDPKTGEFDDSPQARVRARLLVNFGNPFKDKRGNTFIAEEFANQRPPSQRSMSGKSLFSESPPHGK
jgi:integrator complex subunit 6